MAAEASHSTTTGLLPSPAPGNPHEEAGWHLNCRASARAGHLVISYQLDYPQALLTGSCRKATLLSL
jgi:hypothetical protein